MSTESSLELCTKTVNNTYMQSLVCVCGCWPRDKDILKFLLTGRSIVKINVLHCSGSARFERPSFEEEGRGQ